MSSTSKETYICDLDVGHIDQPLLLTGAAIHETRKGDPYLRCTLADKTGELAGIKWDTDEAPEAGLYWVTGLVESYQGGLQIKIDGLGNAHSEDLSEFIQSADVDHLEQELDYLLGALEGEVGDVVRCIFADDEIREAFLVAPAATKNHHTYRGGLADHTISMARLADKVATHYGEDVDQDLLLAGALLHDLGKVRELEKVGLEWVRDTRGELVGHIAECTAMIHDACLACLASDRTRDRLMHMVLSHHGKLEWGSPVKPKLIEAQLLHLIDMMDSRVEIFRGATDGLEEGELSERVWALGGKVVG
ncbi:MAG: 3'-5' exoribonuclease YhaM family protein [Persicimonas sp.]